MNDFDSHIFELGVLPNTPKIISITEDNTKQIQMYAIMFVHLSFWKHLESDVVHFQG